MSGSSRKCVGARCTVVTRVRKYEDSDVVRMVSKGRQKTTDPDTQGKEGVVSPRYFAHYWRNKTLETYRASGDVSLHYVADNRFAERGVEVEDVVYPVTIRDGILFLIGRLEVERVCGFEEAKVRLGYEPSWEATHYLIGAKPTQKHFDL